jgi:hypothetical protein
VFPIRRRLSRVGERDRVEIVLRFGRNPRALHGAIRCRLRRTGRAAMLMSCQVHRRPRRARLSAVLSRAGGVG